MGPGRTSTMIAVLMAMTLSKVIIVTTPLLKKDVTILELHRLAQMPLVINRTLKLLQDQDMSMSRKLSLVLKQNIKEKFNLEKQTSNIKEK